MMIKLSIVTINWNNDVGLEKTLNSVFSQEFKDFEVIVIDGASNDRSIEVIRKFSQSLAYWISESDKGIYDAMNKGIVHASGEYLLFLNSGDYLLSDNILGRIFSQERTSDFIFGCVKKEFGYRIVPPTQITVYSILYDLISHQASFIKKSLFTEIGLYDVNVRIVADWKFLFEAIIMHQKNYEVLKINIAYCDSKGVSGTSTGIIESANSKYEIVQHFLPKAFDDIVELHRFKKRTFKRIYNGIVRRCFNFAINLSH